MADDSTLTSIGVAKQRLGKVRARAPSLHAVGPAFVVAIVTLGVYLPCLPPGVAWWDTAEAQTVPYVAGIFHPTGFPAYAMAGWIFTHAVPFGNIAWRMTLMSAVATALAASALVATLRRLEVAWPIALVSGVAFATTPVVWEHGTRAGVNAFALLLFSLAASCALYRRVSAAAFLAGLAIATHPVSIWLLPGLGLLMLDAVRDARTPWRTATGSLLVFVIGLCAYAYLPVRDAMIAAAHLDPTAALSIDYHPIWDYDHPATLAGFTRLISGADFSASGSLAALLDVARYPAFLAGFANALAAQITLYGMLLALVGWARLRKRPLVALGLLLAAFGVFPFALTYWTLTDAGKYYLPALWITSVCLGLGVALLERGLRRFGRGSLAVGPLALSVVIAINAANAPRFFEQRLDRSAEGIIASVREFTPDDAIVATPWWYATPLFYAAYVERSLGNRLIVTNVSHEDIVNLARTHPVFYFPIPDNDLDVSGAVLRMVPNGWPAMYRVVLTSRRSP